MKIEKVNDHQIRCTLTKADLADRELKISELAYGTEKAKNLFRDMMQQANFEFGFEAEDIPLMIEAIPMNNDCIVLIITKVEDPEELDTRFAKFAPSSDNNSENEEDVEDLFADASEKVGEIMDLFQKLHGAMPEEVSAPEEDIPDETVVDSGDVTVSPKKKSEDSDRKVAPKAPGRAEAPVAMNIPLVRLLSFGDLDSVIRFAHIVKDIYHGMNSLYRDDKLGRYLLLMLAEDEDPAAFNRIVNLGSEYGKIEHYSASVEAYLEEHYNPILYGQALNDLLKLA